MLDLLAPALTPEQGERLTRPAYKQDFREREEAIRDGSSWKLERRQYFEEQGSPSRDALRRGDWEEAVRLFADRRDTLAATAQEDERRGYAFHRVRVVEKPLTPYVQWELHSQRQRAEYGQRIRVVPAAQVAASEGTGPLPEVVVGAAAPSSKFCTPKRGLRMARSATPTVILSSAGRTTSRRSTRWVKR
ncbi:DUF6879 family protein [Streptomyces malaysiensis]|uniref:DUF6879 domain-containing protein n=1 Tax=Streptomyces malaysiensis TaxID=92644 RepID=A0A2J7YXY2_STRMQ|nr:DUF6879 family protein [Streptomyces malaysiensis]PNG92881.1 hypothetical protein SMF913_28346 [Streptomyces malaysiensis]